MKKKFREDEKSKKKCCLNSRVQLWEEVLSINVVPSDTISSWVCYLYGPTADYWECVMITSRYEHGKDFKMIKLKHGSIRGVCRQIIW